MKDRVAKLYLHLKFHSHVSCFCLIILVVVGSSIKRRYMKPLGFSEFGLSEFDK